MMNISKFQVLRCLRKPKISSLHGLSLMLLASCILSEGLKTATLYVLCIEDKFEMKKEPMGLEK